MVLQALVQACNELVLFHRRPDLCWWIWCCGSKRRSDSGRKVSPPALPHSLWRCPCSLCCAQDALQISRSLPQGSFCLEEAPTFGLIWIILIWGNEWSFGSFSPLGSALSPQSHFCAPCYCCTSSLWALPAAGEAWNIPWELLLISSQAPGQLPCAQRPSWGGVCVLLMLLCSVDLDLVKHMCLQKSWLRPGKQVAPHKPFQREFSSSAA